MLEPQQQLENSASFWIFFTNSISTIRKSLQLLAPNVAEDLETILKLKLQLSNLQVCKFNEYFTDSVTWLWFCKGGNDVEDDM